VDKTTAELAEDEDFHPKSLMDLKQFLEFCSDWNFVPRACNRVEAERISFPTKHSIIGNSCSHCTPDTFLNRLSYFFASSKTGDTPGDTINYDGFVKVRGL